MIKIITQELFSFLNYPVASIVFDVSQIITTYFIDPNWISDSDKCDELKRYAIKIFVDRKGGVGCDGIPYTLKTLKAGIYTKYQNLHNGKQTEYFLHAHKNLDVIPLVFSKYCKGCSNNKLGWILDIPNWHPYDPRLLVMSNIMSEHGIFFKELHIYPRIINHYTPTMISCLGFTDNCDGSVDRINDNYEVLVEDSKIIRGSFPVIDADIPVKYI